MMLSIQHISKVFGPVKALNDISFDVHKAKFWASSGKTVPVSPQPFTAF